MYCRDRCLAAVCQCPSSLSYITRPAPFSCFLSAISLLSVFPAPVSLLLPHRSLSPLFLSLRRGYYSVQAVSCCPPGLNSRAPAAFTETTYTRGNSTFHLIYIYKTLGYLYLFYFHFLFLWSSHNIYIDLLKCFFK